MDRGDWWAAVGGVAKSHTRLSNQHFASERMAAPIKQDENRLKWGERFPKIGSSVGASTSDGASG